MSSSGHGLRPPSLTASTAQLISPFGSASVNSSTKDLTLSTNGGSSSLATNYFPDKFSRPHSPGIHNRKYRKGAQIPKIAGGRDAFRAGEARMPGRDDDDDGGLGWLGASPAGRAPAKLRWNKFKWILFSANLIMTIYCILSIIFCLLTWFNIWAHADVVRVGNEFELIMSTIAAGFGIITAMVGWSGILLNNRSFLAIYTLMLWGTFALILVPGYYTTRRREYNLEGKINSQWSRAIGPAGRLRIQNELQCCGYFSPFVEATISAECYSRSLLPGCKGKFLAFERMVLQRWYIAVFSLVPLHIGVMLAGILCSNHVTYRFGKGMMPKAYRLDATSMAAIIQQYASQLTDRYGAHLPGGAPSIDSRRAADPPPASPIRATSTATTAAMPLRQRSIGAPVAASGYPPSPYSGAGAGGRAMPARQGTMPMPLRQNSAPYTDEQPSGYAMPSPSRGNTMYDGRGYEGAGGGPGAGGARQRPNAGAPGARTPDAFANRI